MYFQQISTQGLSCFSYAIGCQAAGVMMVVDPRRDTNIYSRIAKENGMRITHIFDTHVHADHISGAQQLRDETGADIYIHKNTPVSYEAKKLGNGDEFIFGKTHIQILFTPGHTPCSVSLLISDLARSRKPQMILTGDLLFVGDIGRPDLPGQEMLDEQTENLYNSLYKVLGELPDYLEVYPGHGQGSLCGQGMSAKPSSTLGYERLTNPMLKHSNFEEFKQAIMSSLPMRPQSFSAIIQSNLEKAAILAGLEDTVRYALTPAKVLELSKSGAVILDMRDGLSFGAAHISGSVHVDASNNTMLNWIGMAIAPGKPLLLILPHNKNFEEILLELQRIGYDNIEGWLKGGLSAWIGDGLATRRFSHISAQDLSEHILQKTPLALIDVRNPNEYSKISIGGSINLPLSQIFDKNIPTGTISDGSVIICKSGFRASLAASILEGLGCNDLKILSGGMDAWGRVNSN